jgi:hypothetical protein
MLQKQITLKIVDVKRLSHNTKNSTDASRGHAGRIGFRQRNSTK